MSLEVSIKRVGISGNPNPEACMVSFEAKYTNETDEMMPFSGNSRTVTILAADGLELFRDASGIIAPDMQPVEPNDSVPFSGEFVFEDGLKQPEKLVVENNGESAEASF